MSQAMATSDTLQAPLVWLDMDQRALDDAYDQTKHASNMQQVTQRRAHASQDVRRRLGEPQRIAYGPTPSESLDIYRAARANAPISIFIHGGAWRRRPAADFAVQAELFLGAGIHPVIPDFAGVEDVGGDLGVVADQVARAIAWVHGHAKSFGGDSERIYLLGHSSGAHLGGVMATTDWRAVGLPGKLFKAVLLCSGMYDLKPVRLSKRSEYVAFTDAIEDRLSAQRHIAHLHAPLVLAYGTYESPEFQRQGRDFAAAVKAAGKPVELLVGEGYNHFEIFETMANPYGLLGRAALRMIEAN
jgi:arylformamidase